MFVADTLFPEASMSFDWESMMDKFTPWEQHQGVWFKMESKYAPLGYGGPNGAKLRQLQHLFMRYRGDATHVLTGASVLSPQHSMTAVLSAYYGLQSRHVVGATKRETLFKHDNPRIAAGFGAHFEIIKVGFNPALQAEVAKLTKDSSFVVPYGITRDHNTHPAEEILDFHNVGARQVENMPEEVKTLVVPSGSCNTLTSILVGLLRDSKNLDTLYTVAIGPDRKAWVRERLAVMGFNPDKRSFKWAEYSLHDNGVTYGDRVKETFAGIIMHPTYEGKVIRHLRQTGGLQPDKGTAFWIVGSTPSVDVVRPFFTHPEAV
jgi:1-aminocyclopropane-1-carboxylate deaminase/D-cysteine desulfhydrase-like pyridoxal-dependent ACC family enzyme